MSREAQIAAAGGSLHEHRKATRQMRWWYESLADYMISNPKATQNQIAAHFGRAVSTISTIVRTDAFIAYMRQRRADHSAALDEAVRGKLLNVVDNSLDLMLQVMDKKKDSLPIRDLKDISDSALKALGYGGGPSVVVNNNQPQTNVVVPVSLADLQAAQIALRNSQRHQLIDVTPGAAGPQILEDDVGPVDSD